MLEDAIDLNAVLQLPALEFAISDLLPKAGILLVAGSPKAGKSVVVLDDLLRGLEGKKAFGRFEQNYRKALIVNIEGQHQGIKMRDVMFKGLPEGIRERVYISGKRFSFTLPGGQIRDTVFAELADALTKLGADLVVLDPLVSFHSADENNSQQMVHIFDRLREVGVAANCSFVIVHHSRKMSTIQTKKDAMDSGGDMLRGASGMFGAVDGCVFVWQEDPKRLFTFYARYAKPSADLSLAEMQIDKQTMRMYPVIGGIPDPKEWVKDNGVDWPRYGIAFGLGTDLVSRAKGMI